MFVSFDIVHLKISAGIRITHLIRLIIWVMDELIAYIKEDKIMKSEQKKEKQMWEWSNVGEKGKSGKRKMLDQLEECPKIGRGINHDTEKNIRLCVYINMIKGGHFGPWYIFASLTNSSRAQMYIGFVVSLPNKFLFYAYIYFSLLRFPIK